MKNIHTAGKESLVISENNLVIEGQTYTGSLSARVMHEDGRPYHTFRTATLLVNGSQIRFINCTFENAAGPGTAVGQAIALYLDGDDISLEGCVIKGHQDTLFLAPLPEKEREKDGFTGPGQFLVRTPRTFHFRNCLIEGGVDFVFGGATAYFNDCEFRSIEPGYVFAPSTPAGIEKGFIAENCRFTHTDNVPEGSCYLGRPWREYGSIDVRNCEIGSHIRQELWCDWADAIKDGKARLTCS
ncbi:MAG: pectinesterase family protein [Lachnospiraceae bacterium]|nr:pectinesterase family protein [Lachnospiraceae bacterium]